ncbi:hypothetical protein GIB67_031679 [Kingdonia uniflora]|uniref:Uncharacterized protein n=1 Tax=Kingdonia uniflora TaxID=39325 RepID=A0A7J7NKP1_9MAGN|nr:hypothetical protein GIB67_031679 [Kingdonia uniflora]
MGIKSVGNTTNYITEAQAIINGVQQAICRGWNKVWVVAVGYWGVWVRSPKIVFGHLTAF